MTEMTTHERMTRMYAHKEADRVPITDSVWASTLKRWESEGMPKGANYHDYLGLDKFAGIGAENSPQLPEKVVEETGEYIITTSAWGATLKNWKNHAGVPEYIDYTATSFDAWKKMKERMVPTKDRINWAYLEKNYKKWKEEGRWITAGFWFGFDVTHSHAVGTERVLIALIEQPEWIMDMFNTYLDMHIALFQMVWDAGYKFDEIMWYDDMGYKQKQFFSVDMYREVLKPTHKRACDWAAVKGVKARLHSCGNILPFIPELIDIGVGMLNPLEVQSGMDPVEIKKQFGDKIGMHGGLSAILFNHPEKMWAEMKRVIPVCKKNGGYMISTDHSVPESVTLPQFKEFVRLGKELGRY